MICRYTAACIDSSDGLLGALNILGEINDVGIKRSNIPFLSTGAIACKLLGKSRTVLFLGECDEYEPAFTLNRNKEKASCNEVKVNRFDIIKIGEITEESKKFLIVDGIEKSLNNFTLKARNYKHISDNVHDLTNYVNSLHGKL